jgi:hypothetical protein
MAARFISNREANHWVAIALRADRSTEMRFGGSPFRLGILGKEYSVTDRHRTRPEARKTEEKTEFSPACLPDPTNDARGRRYSSVMKNGCQLALPCPCRLSYPVHLEPIDQLVVRTSDKTIRVTVVGIVRRESWSRSGYSDSLPLSEQGQF